MYLVSHSDDDLPEVRLKEKLLAKLEEITKERLICLFTIHVTTKLDLNNAKRSLLDRAYKIYITKNVPSSSLLLCQCSLFIKKLKGFLKGGGGMEKAHLLFTQKLQRKKVAYR